MNSTKVKCCLYYYYINPSVENIQNELIIKPIKTK